MCSCRVGTVVYISFLTERPEKINYSSGCSEYNVVENRNVTLNKITNECELYLLFPFLFDSQGDRTFDFIAFFDRFPVGCVIAFEEHFISGGYKIGYQEAYLVFVEPGTPMLLAIGAGCYFTSRFVG